LKSKEELAEEYYDEEEYEETLNTIEREEEDYVQFLEEFGHIDFSMLSFLPLLRTVDEFQEIRKNEALNNSTAIKIQTLIASNPGKV